MYILLTFDIIKRIIIRFFHFISEYFFAGLTPSTGLFHLIIFTFVNCNFFFGIIQMYFFRNYKATGLYIYIYIDGFFMIRKRRDIHFFTLYFTARALSQVASLWLGPTGISREFKNVNERRIVGRVEFCLIKAGSGSSANFFFHHSLCTTIHTTLSLHLYRTILVT